MNNKQPANYGLKDSVSSDNRTEYDILHNSIIDNLNLLQSNIEFLEKSLQPIWRDKVNTPTESDGSNCSSGCKLLDDFDWINSKIDTINEKILYITRGLVI